MKKFIAGILAFIYISMTSGVLVNVHYCMGKMSGVSYSYHADHACSRCGMESKKGCCHSESKVIRVSDDQQAAKAGLDGTPPAIDALVHAISLLYNEQGTNQAKPIRFYPPPDPYGPPLFLQNKVFRI